MAEYVFDAVVIGAGHNALVTGAYLAKSGLSVVHLERHHNVGGGACTEEVTLPGFLHNLHSSIHIDLENSPWWSDLGMHKFGVSYVYPRVGWANIFEDQRSLSLYTADIDSTCWQIAKFSKKDAQTFQRLQVTYSDFNKNVVRPLFFNQPLPSSEYSALMKKSEAGQAYLRFIGMTPLQIYEELFESEEIRASFLALSVSGARFPQEIDGDGFSWRALTAYPNAGLCIGGSRQLAEALVRCIKSYKGEVRVNASVEKILVKDGTAIGVELADQTRYLARKVVVSGVHTLQTFVQMIGEEYLDREFLNKVTEGFKPIVPSLFGGHLAMSAAPRLKAAELDPAVGEAFIPNMGFDTVKEIKSYLSDWEAERITAPRAIQPLIPTNFDPSQAPSGKHTALIYSWASFGLPGGPNRWDEIRLKYLDECIDMWKGYCTDLKDENVLGKFAHTPLDMERYFPDMIQGSYHLIGYGPDHTYNKRPIPDLANCRTPIKGLYLSSSVCHPGGDITGAPGYISATAIADDLGFRWWAPPKVSA